MQELTKKSKITIAIILLIIVIGLVVIFTKGFNVELKYQENQSIELYLGKEFEKEKIKEITKEVLGEQETVIQTVEVYKDMVSIKAKEITEEQKTAIIEKVNEAYELELSTDEVEISKNSNVKLKDLMKPYVLPLIIVWAITTIYFLIRYFKKGLVKVVCISALTPIVAEALLFSIIAIIRLPMGRIIPVLMLITYVCSILVIDNKLNK